MATHQNRLALEASPYLLQHAHNPVDWYPWGAEALERARREDRPILLSIGYAACHWCHVMERESFEDAVIAARMNELFLNIKVDREERPDLDQIYQLTVQLMGRSGGWPLTVFLTPDQRPFYAGTYFPPKDRHGMSGFPKVLDAVFDAFKNRRAEVEEQAQELTAAIERVTRGPQSGPRADGKQASRQTSPPIAGPAADTSSVLRLASRKLLARFDNHHGGFGSRPKFPNTMGLDVLLRRGAIEGDAVSAESVELALNQMRAGGIWDHLRGGFHRYSTDERWLVPHFEKMLYDNALLLRLYADGYRAFKRPIYAETARSLVGYLFAEMQDPSGGFYSSQDADSEGHEGKFFVWTLGDLRAAVGDDTRAYDAARLHFGITEEGNFEQSGATVLSAHKSIDRVAAILGAPAAEVSADVERARGKMLEARERRPRPSRDDKILTSWNALLISALADAGRALDEPSWVDAAERAFSAVASRLVDGGRVGRYFIGGAVPPSGRRGFLDDHAFLGNAALDLFEATSDPGYAATARSIADAMIDSFWDKSSHTFYFTPEDGESILARTREIYDHAIPSSASMAAILCMRLGELAGGIYAEAAERELAPLEGSAVDNPFGMGQTVNALDRLARGATSVVIVGERGSEPARALLRAAYGAYLPNRSLLLVDPADPKTAEAAPLLAEGKAGSPGTAVAYVCRDRACSAPLRSADELSAALRSNQG